MFVDVQLWRELLKLAGPLIPSMTGYTLMQFMDGLFLARYSPEAVAAIGPASLAAFCVSSFVSGVVGYTSVLASHYVADRLGAGLYGDWAVATVFVMTIATVWLLRFRAGQWRDMRVIEEAG